MQEQNFEKQVQKKMEDLTLPPSAPVWMKVEEQLRRKKEKRRLIIWIFPIGILLAGLLTWSLFNSSNQNPQAELTTQAGNVSNSNVSDTKANNTNLNNNSTAGNSPAVQKEIIKKADDADQPFSSLKPVEQNPVSVNTNWNEKENNTSKSPQAFTNPQEQRPIERTPETLPAKAETGVAKSGEKSMQESKQLNGVPANPADTILSIELVDKNVIAPDKQAGNDIKTETPVVQETQTGLNKMSSSYNKRWTVTPYFSAGISSVSYQSNSNRKSMDMINTGGPASAPVFTPQQLPPAEPTAGFALSAGAYFQKAVSERVKLTTGFGYRLASMHITVGERVDSNATFRTQSFGMVDVDNYYRNGRSQNYTNRYHFVEIPLGLNWQVHKKIPLDLGFGISAAHMIAANALIYDYSAGKFYRNDKVLNKTQINFTSSLNYRLLTIKGKELHGGPFLLHSFTPLEKTTNNAHLFSAGVGLKLNW